MFNPLKGLPASQAFKKYTMVTPIIKKSFLRDFFAVLAYLSEQSERAVKYVFVYKSAEICVICGSILLCNPWIEFGHRRLPRLADPFPYQHLP